jgi:hypothetical protein
MVRLQEYAWILGNTVLSLLLWALRLGSWCPRRRSLSSLSEERDRASQDCSQRYEAGERAEERGGTNQRETFFFGSTGV